MQAQILDLMNDLQKEFNSAIIIITHDLGVVAQMAEDLVVMYGGRVVEAGSVRDIFYRPEHPYTWGLLGSIPRITGGGGRLKSIKGTPPSLINLPSGCSFHPRCDYREHAAGDSCVADVPELLQIGTESHGVALPHRQRGAQAVVRRADQAEPVTSGLEARGDVVSTSTSVGAERTGPAKGDVLLEVKGLQRHFPVTQGIVFQRQTGAVKAVDGIDFTVNTGETLGLVGESGCGKSTTGRLVTRLDEPTGGTIMFQGTDITHLNRQKMRPFRRDVQIIFQDPFSSLNPRQTVGTIIAAPFDIQGIKTEGGTKKAVQELMARVGLNPEHYNRYPHEFSGGQRQRIGIARALALRPRLIVCDEPVSRAGRVDPGAGGEPAGRPAGRLRPGLPVRRARPVGDPAHLATGWR